MKRFSFWLVAIAIFFPVAAFAQQPPISKTNTTAPAQKPATPGVIPSGRVAVIDTTRFPDGIDEYKKQVTKLEDEFKVRTTDLEGIKKKLEGLEEEAKNPAVKPEVLKQKAEQYETLKKEFQRKYEDYQADLAKRRDTVLGPLSEKVYKFLQDYATSRGIIVVFDLAANTQVPLIVTINNNANITDDFMKEYNKANPVAAAPPSPAPNR